MRGRAPAHGAHAHSPQLRLRDRYERCSLGELVGARSNRCQHGRGRPARLPDQQVRAVDGDGRLNKAELKILMLPDPATIDFHGPQVEHIHSVLDHDADGHLSLEELKKNGPMVMSTLGGSSMHDEM